MGKYQAYLQSEHWQSTRRAKQKSVRSAGRYFCEECRTYFPIRFIETHHKHYGSVGHESMEDIQVLCIWCHAAKHDKVELIDKSKVMLTLAATSLCDGEMNELRNSFLSKLQDIEDSAGEITKAEADRQVNEIVEHVA